WFEMGNSSRRRRVRRGSAEKTGLALPGGSVDRAGQVFAVQVEVWFETHEQFVHSETYVLSHGSIGRIGVVALQHFGQVAVPVVGQARVAEQLVEEPVEDQDLIRLDRLIE